MSKGTTAGSAVAAQSREERKRAVEGDERDEWQSARCRGDLGVEVAHAPPKHPEQPEQPEQPKHSPVIRARQLCCTLHGNVEAVPARRAHPPKASPALISHHSSVDLETFLFHPISRRAVERFRCCGTATFLIVHTVLCCNAPYAVQ
jgi:hypothetical protein